MTVAAFLAMLPILLVAATLQGEAYGEEAQPAVRRHLVEEQWILRVPVRPQRPLPRLDWVEGKKFKCVPAGAIRGAMLSGPDQVDFLMPQRQRVRASFNSGCPALDFYGGFYLKTDDERVCARRDSIHSRMGGSCRIERFRRLVPKVRD